MPNRFLGSFLAGALVLALSPNLFAQTPAGSRPSAGTTPDFSGIWTIEGITGIAPDAAAEATARELAAGRIPRFGYTAGEPPMQPWAVERYKIDRADRLPSDGGNDAVDPVMYPYCLPEGPLRSYTISAFEIVHAPKGVYMLFERNSQVRRIYTDGKKHLENFGRSFTGISHGKWDDDTLVVETDNLDGLEGYNKMDTFGHPFTDRMKILERIRRAAPDTLRIDFTFDDPGAYTKTWGGTKLFKLKPDWDITHDFVCEDHLRENFLRDMKSGKHQGRP
ncbi:MAG: hypothetical protein ACRD88_05410 [Terriglobia bacterium]